MRNLFIATLGLSILGACSDDPGVPAEPPVLVITAPLRAQIKDSAGAVAVTGKVTPNPDTLSPVTGVKVNNVPAVLGADGSFTAVIDAEQGFTSIHTEATDANGAVAEDTRAMLAGELRKPGSNIDKAITAAISAEAFTKIAGAAGGMVKNMDLGSMVGAMNPVQHAGDESGPDCLYDQVFLDGLTLSDVKVQLAPADGALDFTIEVDGLNVNGHANYAVACADGSDTWGVTADKIVVSGQLNIATNGMQGFDTKLVNPNVDITNLNISAGGIPGDIIDMMHLDSTIEWVVEKGAELGMGPIMNKALGGLDGPKQLNIMGKTLDLQVAPSAIQFDPSGGLVTLDTSMLIEGSENSPGFVYTDNGMPNMNPGDGFQLGLADDLMNEMMSQFTAIGMLNLTQPTSGGPFDSMKLSMTLPPTISADPADGTMRVMIGDATATFMQGATPIGQAAVNAEIDMKVVPVNNGFGVAVQLGKPVVHVDVVTDQVANQTRYEPADLSKAVEAGIQAQIASMTTLLGGIPLPSVAGLQMHNLSVGSDTGYVMVKGSFN